MKKTYELHELVNLKYSAIDCGDIFEMTGDWEDGVVRYGDEYYTTAKNIELTEMYNEFNKLYEYIGSVSNDSQPYQEDLREMFWSASSLITLKYDDDDGLPDSLFDSVIDPDDEDDFLPLG